MPKNLENSAVARRLEKVSFHSNPTIIVVDFNTPLASMHKPSRQKISKKTQVLNATIDQLYLVEIYRTFHPKSTEYTFFLTFLLEYSWLTKMY